MNFVSLEFLVFLVVVFTAFYSLPDRWRTPFLLAASYFFYGYWSVKYLCLLIFTMGIDYYLALCIAGTESPAKRKRFLLMSLAANLGILFTFKYLNLFAGLAAALTGKGFSPFELALPFGISFYTFHAMSYTVDVYRRAIPAESNFTLYSAYVMFFPQLVAGPIARASHLLPQFATPKRLLLSNFLEGAALMGKGFLFKAVLADSFAGYVDSYLGAGAVKTPMLISQAVYFFAFQIYFDFAGYTLIARGVAKWFGYELLDNFREPYFSASLTDFWRRWHISLSTWLRDYLYIPLGGNRGGAWKTYRNLMLTMILGGLWHGGNWTFAVWGLLHGLYLCVEKAAAHTPVHAWVKRYVPPWIRIVVVFHLVCFAWVFFRAETFTQAFSVLGYWATFLSRPWVFLQRAAISDKLWLMAGLAFGYEVFESRMLKPGWFARLPWPLRFAALYGVILLAVLCRELNPDTFLYFQF